MNGMQDKTRQNVAAATEAFAAAAAAFGTVKEPQAESCETCRFWLLLNVGDKIGNCRRFPPAIHPYSASENCGTFSDWPTTSPSEWCGEYRESYP
jgi:hypothetical protein